MRLEQPYHVGELAVQKQLNQLDVGARNGHVLADSIMPGALKFIGQQQMAVLSSIVLDLSQAGLNEFDPLYDNLKHSR